MRQKLYLIVPGMIISKTDRQSHWISAREIMGLYGVQASDCIVAGPDASNLRHLVGGLTLTVLHPDYHGRYDLGLHRPESFDPAKIGMGALLRKVESLAYQAGGLIRQRRRVDPPAPA